MAWGSARVDTPSDSESGPVVTSCPCVGAQLPLVSHQQDVTEEMGCQPGVMTPSQQTGETGPFLVTEEKQAAVL